MLREELITNFHETEEKVKSGQISAEEGGRIIRNYDITLLNMDDMEIIENADWLNDDDSVFLMKLWLDAQNENLMKIRSFLVLTPQVSPKVLKQFIDSTFAPNQHLELTIQDIFHTFGTGGGVRTYQSPIECGIISYETTGEVAQYPLKNAFDGNPKTSFKSTAISGNSSVTFIFPEFLRVRVTSYKIQAPHDSASIQGWTLEGSNDKDTWKSLAIVAKDTHLVDKGSVAEFAAHSGHGDAFRYLKLTSTEPNHMKTKQIMFALFDVSGELIINPE